jgi:hypothetical protein
MKTLPNDYCRCLDETCPDKKVCLRYLFKDVGHGFVPMQATLRPQWINETTLCPHLIKADETLQRL